MTTAITLPATSVTVPNTAPSHILVLSAETAERVDKLIIRCATMSIDDTASAEQAKANAKTLRALSAEITTKRKEGTAQLDAIITAAIAAERGATSRLELAWAALTTRADEFIAAENKRREEERVAAAVEAKRLQDIENARAEAERQRLLAQAELDAEPGEPPAEVPVAKAVPVYVPERYVPPPLKLATKAKTTFDVEYIDAAKVPITSAHGHLLRPIDKQTLIDYLKSLPMPKEGGCREIPGAVRLVEIAGRAAK